MNKLFWRDMLLIGSAINFGASILALVLAAQGLPRGLAVAVHFAPLPVNLLLFAFVWRHPGRTTPIALASAVWLAAATLL